MYSHHTDQPGKAANPPARGQLNRENEYFPVSVNSTYLKIIWSRETGSAVPSRVSLLISIPRLNLVLPSSAAASLYLFRPPCAIGSVPSLSGHAMAYQWRSLPRVRRHGAIKLQGSSERVLPWQVTVDH